MVQRRSKRKLATVTATRFSARKQARLQHQSSIYGNDYGILPSVKASIIPKRVPLGFVCGYPLHSGGELYGGSMFARSAAMDTLQGKAIHAINIKWGETTTSSAGGGQQTPGRETIGIAVCKKKYKPFEFRVVKRAASEGGGVKVVVERLYACRCHHASRKAVIEQHGVRQGWQPFGVWSMRKAQEQARLETVRLNLASDANATAAVTDGNETTDTENTDTESSTTTQSASSARLHKSLSSMCLNGACTWKVEARYDDIYKEIHGCTESEAEDNV